MGSINLFLHVMWINLSQSLTSDLFCFLIFYLRMDQAYINQALVLFCIQWFWKCRKTNSILQFLDDHHSITPYIKKTQFQLHVNYFVDLCSKHFFFEKLFKTFLFIYLFFIYLFHKRDDCFVCIDGFDQISREAYALKHIYLTRNFPMTTKFNRFLSKKNKNNRVF